MSFIRIDAPAKINLYLDVINKRPDGYHNIATLFQKIRLSDKIEIHLQKKGISLDCSHPSLPSDKNNLVYKAARLMIDESGLASGLKIKLKKNIPVAAGLGGGSSDAASVIVGINRLFKLGLSTKKLMALGKRIGADVPFFISGHDCAVARGIGERLTPVISGKKYHILLMAPPLQVSTKTIYNNIRLRLTKKPCNVNIIARFLSEKRAESGIAPYLYNRLEDTVFSLYPIVEQGKKAMSLYTDRALMSGSGPVIFGLFDDRKEAMRAEKDLKRDCKWQLFLSSTV